MALYAIGDVQGCYGPLQALLKKIRFDATRDRLWFTGDLVNRGPQPAEVLRFVRNLGPRAVAVLGNHDLHLLAVAAGEAAPGRWDRLAPVLEAPDRDILLDWLRHRPLLHHDAELRCTLVHAGLAPQWRLPEARAAAEEVESVLRGPRWRELLREMYGDEPARWDPALRGWPRLRVIVNALTRLRYCSADGRFVLDEKGRPGSQPPGVMPWFAVPGRRSRDTTVVFGHWATLGFWRGPGVLALDSGCVWGRTLTAWRLDPRAAAPVSVPCPEAQQPH